MVPHSLLYHISKEICDALFAVSHSSIIKKTEKPIVSSNMYPKDSLKEPVIFSEIIVYIYMQCSSPLCL